MNGVAVDAENYVAGLVQGRVVNVCYDVLSASGHKLEVKWSTLIAPSPLASPESRVWKFNRLLGDRQNKVYDRLILVGRGLKREYELFDLSYDEALRLSQITRFQVFQVNTNRNRTHSAVGNLVWSRHVEPEIFMERYAQSAAEAHK